MLVGDGPQRAPAGDLTTELRLTGPPLYPRLHRYLRASGVPLLAVWGSGDKIFGPDGARAFTDDVPDAEIHLLEGGHFLLESALYEVTPLIRAFLAKVTGAE